MTILWAGTEPEAFETLCGVSTSTAEYDSNFSRCALNLGQNAAGTTVLCGVVLGGLTEAWFHTRMGSNVLNADLANQAFIEFRTSSAQGILRVICTGVINTFKLQYWSGAAWVDIGTSFTATVSTSPTWDVQCKIDNVNGRFVCYVDGTIVASLIGDTDFFSPTIDKVRLGTWSEFNAKYVSECIISNTSTVGMRLATNYVTGAGTTTGWTSGTFADVDETTVNDADFISSGTANQVDTFALQDLSATAAALIPVAVVGSARARNAPAGPQNLQLAVRTGGTDYFSPTVTSPAINTSFQNGFQNIWNVNPNTGVAWTASEINALEAGAKSIT